jgi:cytochrome c oxidase cbb3-type subunit 3
MRVWIGVCFAVLLLPALIYDGRSKADLLRADADRIPVDSQLMRYAERDGSREFAVHCAQCHGAAGTGDTARGIPDLTDGDWLYGQGTASDIERIITYGIRSDHPKAWNLARMPAYATPQPSSSDTNIPPLDPGQIRDVVEYLYSLQGRAQDRDAAVRGAAVYHNSGGCYDCHSADARGDSAIGAPNLIDSVSLYGDGTRSALYDSIANGRHGICPAWAGRITAAEIRTAALYVYSLSHTAASTQVDR